MGHSQDSGCCFFLALLVACTNGQSCQDFQEGSCPLSEYNMVASDHDTAQPGLCQDKCRSNEECHYFTHFETQCFLLKSCAFIEPCEDCVSGPSAPDFDTCPWPPSPTTHTSPTPPTTQPTTEPTSAPTTTPTTKPTNPTTTSISGCDNFFPGYLCNWQHNVIDHITHLLYLEECQSICQQRSACRFFSFYKDEHFHQPGHCYPHWECAWLEHDNCRYYKGASDSSKYISCMAGPKYPSYYSCH